MGIPSQSDCPDLRNVTARNSKRSRDRVNWCATATYVIYPSVCACRGPNTKRKKTTTIVFVFPLNNNENFTCLGVALAVCLPRLLLLFLFFYVSRLWHRCVSLCCDSVCIEVEADEVPKQRQLNRLVRRAARRAAPGSRRQKSPVSGKTKKKFIYLFFRKFVDRVNKLNLILAKQMKVVPYSGSSRLLSIRLSCPLFCYISSR